MLLLETKNTGITSWMWKSSELYKFKFLETRF